MIPAGALDGLYNSSDSVCRPLCRAACHPPGVPGHMSHCKQVAHTGGKPNVNAKQLLNQIWAINHRQCQENQKDPFDKAVISDCALADKLYSQTVKL